VRAPKIVSCWITPASLWLRDLFKATLLGVMAMKFKGEGLEEVCLFLQSEGRFHASDFHDVAFLQLTLAGDFFAIDL
jgi:hypothetical protein